MLCEECLKQGKESILKRDREYIPEKGLDHLLRKYDCPEGCKSVFMSTGRKYLGQKEHSVQQWIDGISPQEEPDSKPVRPPKKPPLKPEPVKLPEPVPAGV